MKRAIRYLRFSQKGQSMGSIERQELYTDQWIANNQVELVDTFIDRGKTAKNFDRPDFIKLEAFIVKHYKKVDYLIVDQLDRFSRIAGEAINKVKNLQKKYNIQVVSVTEGIVFDYDTPGSFFRAGLQLLLAEEDNINRSIKVRGGLYTARAKEGRFIYRIAPFGYKKISLKEDEEENQKNKDRILVIVEEHAKIVRFIYEMYLQDVPLNIIKDKAREMGFNRKGNMSVERILINPVYAGLQFVKPFKEYPGGLFPALNEKIIDFNTWQLVQCKMKKPEKTRTVIDDNLPLRGVLKCHCGNPISGAPSKGKNEWFYYYKCRHNGHNNISAIKSHNQFMGAWHLMSVPVKILKEVRSGAEAVIEKELRTNAQKIQAKQTELQAAQTKLHSVEEKWIDNEINKEMFDHWHGIYSENILNIKGAIERYSQNPTTAWTILNKDLDLCTDMAYVYDSCDVLEKRELVSMVFDNNLYYENGVYRTPTMMDIFAHNYLEMREKNYLIYEKKRDDLTIIPHSGERGIRTLDTV